MEPDEELDEEQTNTQDKAISTRNVLLRDATSKELDVRALDDLPVSSKSLQLWVPYSNYNPTYAHDD
jgi:hypothetical protein